MNEVLEIYPYSPRTARLTLNAPMVAQRALPGNFIIVRFSEDGQRIPFSIVASDPEKGTIEIIIHRSAGLDDILALLKPGRELPDLLGPLGQPAQIDSGIRVVCCGDGAGFVPMLPLIKALHLAGCKVVSVVSEESAKAACLTEEIEKFSDEVVMAPEGNLKDTVDEIITRHNIEKMWISGPTPMMKMLTSLAETHDIAASCILNMLMIDGIGLCGICRVIVGGERKQTCTDGPVFNARLVDFDQLLNRQRLYC